MKKYVKPYIQISFFNPVDNIYTSTGSNEGEEEFGFDPELDDM